jgi:kinase suppressor of Ras 2
MRSLRVHTDEGEDLPFTKASDVYAFGTVWYEMLTGEWPWKAQPPETIIWSVFFINCIFHISNLALVGI